VLFGYDTLDETDPVTNRPRDSTGGVLSLAEDPPGSEWRGFRREVIDGVGVVQMRSGGSGVGLGCDAAGHTWVNLTDPDTLDVTALQFDFRRGGQAVAATVSDPDDVTRTRIALVGVRPILVTLTARSPADPNNPRELRQWVRVRADSLRLIAAP
jgi:hypothetical protein